MAGKAHHRGVRYTKYSALIRTLAAANPDAICFDCGLKLGRGDRWQAGHTVAGSTTWQPWLDVTTVPPSGDWLAAVHRSCNAADGARIRNALSASVYDW